MTWTSNDLAGLRVIGDTSKPATRPRPATGRTTTAPAPLVEFGGIVAPAPVYGATGGDEAPARVQRLWVGAIAPSINGLYTMHPMTRSSRAKQFKALVVTMCRQQGLQPVERYPVTVRVVCHFGPGRRRYDWENLALSAKWTGDGLREAGILHNDSPDYIAAGTIESRRTESESYMEYFIHEENQ